MDDLIREMIEPRRKALDPARRVRLVATTVTVALAAAGVTSLTTSALFTDTDTMSATDFTTGTVRISPTMSTSVTLGDLNMAPGDTSYGAVTVENAGSLEHRYTVSVDATNAQATNLAGQLELSVYAARNGATVAGSCNRGGVGSLQRLVSSVAVPTTVTEVIGRTAPGQDSAPGGGDRVLGATASETLCVAVHLPLDTSNTYQDTSASLRLTFDAEQTANNP